MRPRALFSSLVVLVVLAAAPVRAADPVLSVPAAQMHFPDVHGDRVVFTHAGDIWIAPLTGGVAQRLTTHPGQELFARFSPDGSRIAFTGEYDGAWHVYVMPVDGGTPRQLTWAPDLGGMPLRMGPGDMVVDWTPDGTGVLFLSRRNAFTPWFGHLWVAPADDGEATGGLPERFPVPKGGLLSFEPRGEGGPDGQRFVYNRIFRNFRTWKRYKGGMAQDLWLFDPKAQRSERLTDWVGTDTSPMWVGETVYFVSDRGPNGRLNLWRLDLKSRETAQLTTFDDFDVLWPATDGRTIVFEKGGSLWTLALPALRTDRPGDRPFDVRPVPLRLPGDRPLARTQQKSVGDDVRGFGLAPGGKRAVIAARGEVFTAPVENGETRNLSRTPGAHEREVAWSPDGRFVAWISDASGEDEVWIAPAVPPETPPERAADARPRQLTRHGKVGRLQPVWSPDVKSILVADQAGRLDLVDVGSGDVRAIDHSDRGAIRHYSWSPDSRYVAYAKPGSEELRGDIWIHDTKERAGRRVTDRWTHDLAPLFSRDGKFLFFASPRRLNPVLSEFDFSFAYTRAYGIFAVALTKDTRSPFEAPPDEAVVEGPAEKGGKKGKKGEDEDAAPPEVRIDWDGIAERVVDLPVPGMNLEYLAAVPGGIVYLRKPTRGLGGPLAAEEPSLHRYDLEKRKDVELLRGVSAISVSPDGAFALIRRGEGRKATYQVGPLGADPVPPDKWQALDLSHVSLRVEPETEWRAMFFDAWRLLRDTFYRGTMHGLDWEGLRDRYAALLPGVKSRFDLTLLLGELVGELSNSHTYVNRGDEPDLGDPKVGALGADLALDPKSGRYRIARILPGENWRADRVSPLTVPGVSVKAGEYLLAIEGEPLRAPTNPYALLAGRAGVPTTLTVGPEPDGDDARFVRVTPIASEHGLRYLDWVRTNRERVERLSGGIVGYVYVPDMSRAGLDAFVEQWFPQVRKQGMVIDVRYNGGGFVDQLLFERLRRVVKLMSLSRHGQPEPFLEEAFHGHMACVTNAYAASDGDLFSWFFRKYELGPLVGTRTWGGVRGIRGFQPLIDGGGVTIPEFSVYDMDSEWVMENEGVEPTHEVDNRPEDVLAGRDPQLETAVRLVLERIQADPRPLPPAPKDLPPYPPKGR